MIERLKRVGELPPVALFQVLGGVVLDKVMGLARIADDALDINFEPADYRIPDFKVEAPVAREEDL